MTSYSLPTRTEEKTGTLSYVCYKDTQPFRQSQLYQHQMPNILAQASAAAVSLKMQRPNIPSSSISFPYPCPSFSHLQAQDCQSFKSQGRCPHPLPVGCINRFFVFRQSAPPATLTNNGITVVRSARRELYADLHALAVFVKMSAVRRTIQSVLEMQCSAPTQGYSGIRTIGLLHYYK